MYALVLVSFVVAGHHRCHQSIDPLSISIQMKLLLLSRVQSTVCGIIIIIISIIHSPSGECSPSFFCRYGGYYFIRMREDAFRGEGMCTIAYDFNVEIKFIDNANFI